MATRVTGWIARQHAFVVIGVAGALVALATYDATAGRPADAPGDFDTVGRSGGTVHLSPYVTSWSESHFDPWTGLPLGWSTTENPHGFGEIIEHGAVPPDMVGRRAIPLPLGLALGAMLGLALVVVTRRVRVAAGDPTTGA
jgi:hypothetical protein